MTEENFEERQENWIVSTAIEYNVPEVEVRESQEKQIENCRGIGLDKTLSEVEFWDAIRAAILADVTSNITVEPTEFEVLWIGNYPTKYFSNKIITDCVTWAALTANNPEMALITAWGEDDNAEIQKSNPLTAFTTGFTYFPESKPENRFNLSVQKATNLMAGNPPKWAGESYDFRLKLLQENVPLISLGNVQNSLSSVITQENKKPYTDVLDMRRIRVFVKDYNSGVRKDGNKWALYNVSDATYKAVGKNKFFTVWVDPRIGDAIGAGEGSYLEIYGIITRSGIEFPQMSACFVHPLGVKPKAGMQIQKDAPTSSPGAIRTPMIKLHLD